MNISVRWALTLLLALLAGCAQQSPPQQVNLDDYVFQTSIDACRQKTWDLMHDSRQPIRASYFKGCMEDRGYSEQSYKHLWIDVLD